MRAVVQLKGLAASPGAERYVACIMACWFLRRAPWRSFSFSRASWRAGSCVVRAARRRVVRRRPAAKSPRKPKPAGAGASRRPRCSNFRTLAFREDAARWCVEDTFGFAPANSPRGRWPALFDAARGWTSTRPALGPAFRPLRASRGGSLRLPKALRKEAPPVHPDMRGSPGQIQAFWGFAQ